MKYRFVLGLTLVALSLSAQPSGFRLTPVAPFDVNRRGVSAIAFSSDGKYLASGAADGQVYVIDLLPAVGTPRPIGKGTGKVVALGFDSSSALLGVACEDGSLFAISMGPQPAQAASTRLRGKVRAAAVSADGLLAAAVGDSRVVVWAMRTASEMFSVTLNAKKPIRSLGFTHGGRSLVGVSEDGVIIEWETSTQRELHNMRDQRTELLASTVSLTSPLLAISSQESGLSSAATREGNAGGNTAGVTVGGGGTASGGASGGWSNPGGISHPTDLQTRNYIVTFDLTTGTAKPPIGGIPGEVRGLALSPDSRYIGLARQWITDYSVDILDLATGRAVAHERADKLPPAMAFSPDAHWFAVATLKGQVNLYGVSGVYKTGGVLIEEFGQQCIITSKYPDPLLNFTNPTRIAVLDFETPDGNRTRGRSVADSFRTRIAGAENVKMYERDRMDKLIEEQSDQRSIRFDQATAVKLGRMAGVQKALFGVFDMMGPTSFKITLRLVDVETGAIDGFREVVCDPMNQSQFPQAVEILSRVVVKP